MSSDEFTALRRHLHSIAEVSGQESDTAAYIADFLNDCQPDAVRTGLGGHGVLARFGDTGQNASVLLRCELDALPIAESNDFDYQSDTEGVGHKCGHDGHMAIMCGVARRLAEDLPDGLTVWLLFQPAEETGQGARAVLDDEQFSDVSPDYVFALHNIPSHEMRQVILRPGPFAAASVGFKARFRGQTAHAAHPEQGRSPAAAVAQLILALSGIPQHYAALEEAAKVTVVQAHVGEEAFGTSPGRGEVMATLRTYDDRLLERLKAKARELAQGIAHTYGLELETEWVEPFPATVNDAEAVGMVRDAAEAAGLAVSEKEEPFGWSEDFGHFTGSFKGALFGLGSGTDQPALHAQDYDFPDELIDTGITVFMGIIRQLADHREGK